MSTKGNRIYRSYADFNFFQIAVEVNALDTFSHMLTKDEIKKTDRNKTTLIKQSVTLENWEDRKVKFFKQRMGTYKEYLTDAEKINREINTLEKLQINTDDYKDLSDRYKKYLFKKLEQTQQIGTNKAKHINKEFKDFFNSDIQLDVITKIQNNCKKFIGKDMAYLIYLLDVDFGFITYTLNGKTDGRIHFVKALNKNIKSMQGINKYFNANSKELDVQTFNTDPRFVKIKTIISKTIK